MNAPHLGEVVPFEVPQTWGSGLSVGGVVDKQTGCVEWVYLGVFTPRPKANEVNKSAWRNVETAGTWSATFNDALGAGLLAVQLWRRGIGWN
jgi:hypothetical protein